MSLRHNRRLIVMMLAALALLSVCDEANALGSLLGRAVPKVLYFENLKEPVRLEKVSQSGEHAKALCMCGARAIEVELAVVNGTWEVIYAQADNAAGWEYVRATAEDDAIGIGYMEKMVNSVSPPSLVRSTSHRVKNIGGDVHHQMTLIMELYGRRSLQFVEWKFYKDKPTKHTCVDHQVIVRDGGEI